MARLNIPVGWPAERYELILKYAVDFYKSEIDNFWKRSIFFWGFIGASFVAYGALYDKSPGGEAIRIVACFGLVCSVAWSLLNRGSKYWYEAWEQKVAVAEEMALEIKLFMNIEDLIHTGWWGAARYSVSKITIALSDFVVLAWIALLLRTLPIQWPVAEGCYAWLTVIGTLAYIVFLLFGCRSSVRPKI
jgi:hypothetical protein